MSNWNEILETLSRLNANGNGEKKSLAGSAAVTVSKNDQLCASLIERSLAASIGRSNNNNEVMEIYTSIFGFEYIQK